MTYFRNDIAAKCGVNAAIVAQMLWDRLIDEAGTEKALERHGCFWSRCSARMMTAELPFLSIHMAKDAVGLLRENGYIRKGCFNDNRFDHTNWYSFTEYGVRIMEVGDE